MGNCTTIDNTSLKVQKWMELNLSNRIICKCNKKELNVQITTFGPQVYTVVMRWFLSLLLSNCNHQEAFFLLNKFEYSGSDRKWLSAAKQTLCFKTSLKRTASMFFYTLCANTCGSTNEVGTEINKCWHRNSQILITTVSSTQKSESCAWLFSATDQYWLRIHHIESAVLKTFF